MIPLNHRPGQAAQRTLKKEKNNPTPYPVRAGICKTRIQNLFKCQANSPEASTYWLYVQ